MLLALCLHKSHIWENSGSRVMSQNAFSQSDCRILKSAISQEKIDQSTCFWHAVIDSRNIKICKFLVWPVQKYSWPIIFQDLKSAICQEQFGESA